MPPETLLNLTLLAVAAAWTPGPNNALVATSGALFGLRRTWPHVLGIALGYPLMVFLVALGLGELFRASPLFNDVLRWAGAALLLYVAWISKRWSIPIRPTPTRTRLRVGCSRSCGTIRSPSRRSSRRRRMSLVVAAIEIGLIWYMGRVVDLLSSARRRRCCPTTGWS
jgi:hypothetical protein